MPRWRAGIAGLVLAATLTACTGEPQPTPTQPTVAANAPNDVNPAARDTLAQGGVVRLRLHDLPTQWNPHLAGDATDDLRALTEPLTAPAFLLDAAGRATPNPDVVTAVDVSHTDATRVTLTLHPEAVWGDGARVTAEDWAATWRALSGRVAGIDEPAGRTWARVSDVAAGADDHTVVVTYDGICPDWAEPLVPGPLRARAVADADAFGWDLFDPARYAGPFTVTHVDARQGVVTLEPNPTWWGDAPRLTHVVYRTLTDAAAPAAFRNNELDLLGVGTARDVAEKVRGGQDTTLRTAPAPAGRLLRLNLSGLLQDDIVRRALLLGIDRSALAEADLTGLGSDATTWSDPLLLPNQPGYTDQARATGLVPDPERAAAELTADGWTPTPAGVLARDGRTLTLTMAVPTDDPLAATEFASLADALGALGIELTPAGASTTQDADIHAVDQVKSAFPLADLSELIDADLADHAARIGTETDVVRRADQASQLSRLLWERVDAIPLYQRPQVVAVRNRLANVGAGSFATTTWEDVGWQG